MSRKITIIGGSGFIGTNLCRQLALKQKDFEIIDIKMSSQFPEKCKVADVRDAETLRASITGDVIVNLAAVHRDDVRDKDQYEKTNVGGAENIARICEEKNIRKIIFTSTVAVYGFAAPGTDETGAIKPFNEYGRTKYNAEEKLRAWQRGTDNSLLIVRPTVVFGEGNRGNVFNLLKQIASGKFLMVGAGENKKSMAYVGNVVAFLETCIQSDRKYGVYNYVDTPDLTMNELVCLVRAKLKGRTGVGPRVPYYVGIILGYTADLISKLTGKNLPISSIRVKKFATPSEFRSAKLDLDNFQAPITLNEALERTIKKEFLDKEPQREIFYTE